MADDIKIRVGVQSTVKQDMDRLVSDIARGADKVNTQGTLEALLKRGKPLDVQKQTDEAIANIKDAPKNVAARWRKESMEMAKAWGPAGKQSAEQFADGFYSSRAHVRRIIRDAIEGDVSGIGNGILNQVIMGFSGSAVRSSVAKLGASLIGRIALPVGTFLGSFAIGDKLGQKLGIKDKLIDFYASLISDAKRLGEEEEKIRLGEARLQAVKSLADAYKKAQTAAQSLAAHEAKIRDIREAREAGRGGANEQLGLEQRRYNRMLPGLLEAGISEEERRKRQIAIEEQASVVEEASRRAAEEDQRAAEQSKKSWLDAEEEKGNAAKAEADRRARNLQVEMDMANMLHRQDIEAAQKQIEAERAKVDALNHAIEKRQKELDLIIAAGEAAAAQLPIVAGAHAGPWQAQQDADAKRKRDVQRQMDRINEWRAMQARGVQLPPRAQAAIDAFDKAQAGNVAAQQADALKRQAEKAQVDSLAEIKILNGKMQGLQDQLQRNLRVGGG